jgi:hypothetical protein
MATNRSEIQEWFERGVAKGATHMIVVCDTFDWEDYPVYVQPGENVEEAAKRYDGREMQKIMKIYKLSDDMASQLSEHRAYHL